MSRAFIFFCCINQCFIWRETAIKLILWNVTGMPCAKSSAPLHTGTVRSCWKVSLALGGGGEGGVLSWECCFSPAGYIKYSDILVIITNQNKFEQLWGWGRTLFTLRLWECEYVSAKENFEQLEELRLHSEVNPNPRTQQSGLDFPWPHCLAVMQPCGCSSFISKRVLCNAQHPQWDCEVAHSSVCGSTWGTP